ncbi:MAG: phosphoglycerate kinase [Saccharofermentanales bacterium]
MEIKIHSYKEVNYEDKNVLLRIDINSPLDPETKKITNFTRLERSVPTLKYILEQGAKVAIIAHQGDTLDYHNLYPLAEHAEILSNLLDRKVDYIDDVCGPAAINAVKKLNSGDAIILGNLRYLTEEVSVFETVVDLTPQQMTKTWLIRQLAPLFDVYINEAFSAAHRYCPSMVAFQEVLPSAAGELFFQEYSVLSTVLHNAKKPSVFVLGGAKISDAFGMMEQVLAKGTADKILTTGVVGQVMLMAKGIEPGKQYTSFLKNKDFLQFVEPAKKYLTDFPGKIEVPLDVAYAQNGQRIETPVENLPIDDASFSDIGEKTMKYYGSIIESAGTLFCNGPAGVYEDQLFEAGTRSIMEKVAAAEGFSVIGGGDSVQAAGKYIDLKDIDYVCTAGGAMVRFMTGETLALVRAMESNVDKFDSMQ